MSIRSTTPTRRQVHSAYFNIRIPLGSALLLINRNAGNIALGYQWNGLAQDDRHS
jgi:hypothetical protein